MGVEVKDEGDHGEERVEEGVDLVETWIDAQALRAVRTHDMLGMDDGLGMYGVLPCLEMTSLRHEATDPM